MKRVAQALKQEAHPTAGRGPTFWGSKRSSSPLGLGVAGGYIWPRNTTHDGASAVACAIPQAV